MEPDYSLAILRGAYLAGKHDAGRLEAGGRCLNHFEDDELEAAYRAGLHGKPMPVKGRSE